NRGSGSTATDSCARPMGRASVCASTRTSSTSTRRRRRASTPDRAPDSMRTTPYWWDGVWPFSIPRQPLPGTADVVVVGSGYTGLSAALTLLKHGRSVVVIEARRVAEGASSRNGGMIGDLLKPSVAELAARFGTQMASRLCCEFRDALVRFPDFLAENAIRCDFERSGRITGALSETQLAGLLHESEALRRLTGVGFEVVAKSDLAGELGTETYVGARLYRHHASLHPAKYVG